MERKGWRGQQKKRWGVSKLVFYTQSAGTVISVWRSTEKGVERSTEKEVGSK